MQLPNYNIVEIGARASARARAFGRKMIALIAAVQLDSNKLYRLLDDGTELIASRAQKQYRLTITTPAPGASALDTNKTNLWIPRGFVVYPSSSASETGWGTPNIFTGSRFAATKPGLDVARWSSGGALGEVLLTRNVDGGYPASFMNPLPMWFSAFESPKSVDVIIGTSRAVRAKKTYTPPPTGPWIALRMEFDGFKNTTGQGGTARRGLFNSLNSGRNYLLPIRGYYDAAARDVRYIVSADFSGAPWLTDGALSTARVGYVTATERKAKDGVLAPAIDTITRASDSAAVIADLESEADLGGSTFDQPRTTLSLGIRNGLHALTAAQHDQWIAYGVRFWLGDDAAIPAISWDGYPSINWPGWIFGGSVDASAWVDLDWFVQSVRGTDRPIFSKRICANGRVLGTLPDFVISAGVQTRVEGHDTIDRLLVLTWRLSDQLLADPTLGFLSDYMRRMRLYFVDARRRNGLALALDHAVIGLYDATTNPDGWHYAGLIDLIPEAGSDPPAPAVANIAAQPPMFKGDGTRVLYCAEFINVLVSPLYVRELALSGIGDGTVTAVATVDFTERYEDAFPLGVGVHTFLAADYVPSSDKVRSVYASALIDGVIDCVRWSHSANPSDPHFHDSDIVVYDGSFHGYEFGGVFVQDVVTGTFTTIHEADDSTTFRAYYATQGKPAVFSSYAAGAGSPPSITSGLFFFNNRTDILMPVFARDRAGNYIAGHELGLLLDLPQAATFDTNIGDLQALTKTPGAGLRLYPIGVV